MILSEDIISLFNPKTVYGKKGDTVVVVSYNGSVAIVEDLRGQRFSMQAALLSCGTLKGNEVNPVPAITSPQAPDQKPIKKAPGKKGSKVTGSQNNDMAPSLF